MTNNSTHTDNDGTEILQADSDEDRFAVMRLRYEVYIEEQGKPYPQADHNRRALSDDLDKEAILFAARQRGEIVGTIRINWLPSDRLSAAYEDIFHFSEIVEIQPGAMCVISRLAVSKSARDRRIRLLLFDALYETALIRGTRVCFATCSPDLVRLFRLYGFREYIGPFTDSIVGPLSRIALALDDLEHLQKVGSRLLPIAERNGIPMGKHTTIPWVT